MYKLILLIPIALLVYIAQHLLIIKLFERTAGSGGLDMRRLTIEIEPYLFDEFQALLKWQVKAVVVRKLIHDFVRALDGFSPAEKNAIIARFIAGELSLQLVTKKEEGNEAV